MYYYKVVKDRNSIYSLLSNPLNSLLNEKNGRLVKIERICRQEL